MAFIVLFPIIVSAQNVNEGRISEHLSFTLITLAGIIILTLLARKTRREYKAEINPKN